ncbi:hypothetical protein RvY_07027 [Ramazzottius varieornatus]|uniref:Uncharacterized protein n=1 Tax=Ramazzottius varieornatus TaxID=947166 RepID=A0A1D1V0M7_RAMVA|nr:hypothetical protein RvY_07027 [Ramazzottius varieornatus]
MPFVIGKTDVSNQEYRYIYEHVEVWRIDQDTGEIVLIEVGEECNWGEQHSGMVNTNYGASLAEDPEEAHFRESTDTPTSSFVSFGSYRKQHPQEVDCGGVYFPKTDATMTERMDPYDADSSVTSSGINAGPTHSSLVQPKSNLPAVASTSSFCSYRDDVEVSQEAAYPKARFPKCAVVKSRGLPSVKFYGSGSFRTDSNEIDSPRVRSADPDSVSVSSFVSYCKPPRKDVDPTAEGYSSEISAKASGETLDLDECKPIPPLRSKMAPPFKLSSTEPTGLVVPSFVTYCEEPPQHLRRGHAVLPSPAVEVAVEKSSIKLKLHLNFAKPSSAHTSKLLSGAP